MYAKLDRSFQLFGRLSNLLILCFLAAFGYRAQCQQYYFKPDWPIGKKASFHITTDTLVDKDYQKAFTCKLETEVTQENTTHYIMKIHLRVYGFEKSDSVLMDELSFFVGIGKDGVYNDFSWNTDMDKDSLELDAIWTRPLSKVWIPDLIRINKPVVWSHWDLWKVCVERIILPIRFIYDRNWSLKRVSTIPTPPNTLYPGWELAQGPGQLKSFDEKNHGAEVEWEVRHSKFAPLRYEIKFDYAYSMPMDVKIEIGSAVAPPRQITKWKYILRG